MADLLIAPEGYTTPGGVPRKLLAGVFLVVALTAMCVFLLTSNDEPLLTGDQKARAELMKPESIATQAKGNGKWVDDAADKARSDVEEGDKRRLALSHAGGPAPSALTSHLVEPDTSEGLVPLPGDSRRRALDAHDGVTAAGRLDPAAAERDVAARSAAGLVFDDGAKTSSSEPTEALSDIARMAHTATALGMHGASDRSDQMAPLLEAMKASQGGPAPPPTRAESDQAWAAQQARPVAGGVLRQQSAGADLMLFQGTVIPCVLTRRLNSDMPGVVTARVSMDVYDSRTSRRLLLPKGALLVGAYNNDVRQGQSRLQFAFTRLRMPDGSTFELPGATGSDVAGQGGTEGNVNRHFLRNFGSALLLGVLADRVTKVSALPTAGPNGQGAISATGQVFVDTARAELERNRATAPTVTVPEGTRVNVEVVRDMAFDSVYRGT